MIAANLPQIYLHLRQMGLVRNRRDLSTNFLGKNRAYLKNIEARAPLTVPLRVVQALRSRLAEVERFCPPGIAQEIREIIAGIDRDCLVAQRLGWV